MQRWITVLGFTVFALLSQQVMAVPGDLIRRIDNGGNISSSVAIDEASGNVYMGSADKKVYAYDAAGILLWQFLTGDMIGSSPTLNEDGSVLYVGSHDGTVYALATADGSELWRFNTGGVVFASPAVGMTEYGYSVIVGSADNNVYSINAASGAENWHYATGGEVSTAPVITRGGIVYAGSGDGFLYALDANIVAGDRLNWRFEAPGSGGMFSPIIDKKGNIYVGAFNNILYSLRATGSDAERIRWSRGLNGRIASSPAIGTVTVPSPVSGNPDITISMLYVGTFENGYMNGIDQANGADIWSFATGSRIYSSPSVSADGTVIFGTTDGMVYALDSAVAFSTIAVFLTPLDVSVIKWSYAVDTPVYSSPTIDNAGNTYINTVQSLYLLEDDSGGPAATEWPMFAANSRNSGSLSSSGSNVAVNDVYLVNRDLTPSLVLDVLQNDIGGSFTITNAPTSPDSTIDVISGGLRINYTPNAGFTGLDTFSYSITGSSADVVVSVTDASLDSDFDLMDDVWEIATFGNLTANGTSDVNTNGINDLDEYIDSLGVITPPPVVADGDINGDGVIDLSDVLAAQRHVLGVQLLSSDAIARGDLYPAGGDGELTLSDILLIQQAILAQTPPILDSDGDLLPDDWEIANGLNPNDGSDAMLDSDGDGLTNLQERYFGTLPGTIDTDGDGFSDGEEAGLGSSPTNILNYPVKITSVPVTEASAGSAYSYELLSNQTGAVYQLVDAPAGVEIIVIADSSFIQWAPSAVDLGMHNISVIARVDGAPSDTQTYSLNIVLPGISGDVNMDGFLTLADNLLAQRHLLKEIVLTTEQLALADVYPAGTPDGKITISDILLIQQFVLGGR